MSLIESLTARPNPELALFGQFVGDWDMDIEFYNEDGETIYRGLGLWSFGWVLDGHAIQDVFSYPTGSGRGIGTTLRTYSRDRGEWQIVYLGAVSGVTAILHGGREGDNIVLRGTDEDGHNRWTFSDIRADSFSWTGELSPDGATFHVNHRMTGTRRAPSGGGNGAAPEAASFTPQMLGRAENTLPRAADLVPGRHQPHVSHLGPAQRHRDGRREVRPGQLTAIAVNALKIDRGAVDAALATLAEAELVTTPPGLVRLTDAGSQLYLRLRDAMAPATARLIQGHSADDLAATGRVLTAITDRANEILARRN
jgi:hypothetical protein